MRDDYGNKIGSLFLFFKPGNKPKIDGYEEDGFHALEWKPDLNIYAYQSCPKELAGIRLKKIK